jgi:hypothetical protein
VFRPVDPAKLMYERGRHRNHRRRPNAWEEAETLLHIRVTVDAIYYNIDKLMQSTVA